MSTISSTHDSRTELLYNQRVQTERRSFFFNVKRAQEGEPYLTVSQYSKVGDEWIRLKVVVAADEAKTFYQGLCEALKALRLAGEQFEGKSEAQSASQQPADGQQRKKPVPVRSGS
jgi:hypothetical protein